MGYKRVDSYDNARDKVKHKIRFRLLPLHHTVTIRTFMLV